MWVGTLCVWQGDGGACRVGVVRSATIVALGSGCLWDKFGAKKFGEKFFDSGFEVLGAGTVRLKASSLRGQFEGSQG